MWEPRHLATQRASKACYRDSFTFLGIEYMSRPIDSILIATASEVRIVKNRNNAYFKCFDINKENSGK
jgi:hypothetical protein